VGTDKLSIGWLKMNKKKAYNISFDASGLGSLFRSGGFATYTPQATQAACTIAVFVVCNFLNHNN